MAAAFGFSVGDFIGTISLIKDIIKALNDSTGARPAYKRLQVELSNLDGALTRVHNLEVHATQQPQKAALQTVAVQCQESIKRFLEKNAKFQGTLGHAPSSSSSRLSSSSLASSWRSNLHKVQWARFKNDSINALRAELAGYTATINLILHLIQAATVKTNADAIDTCLQSVRVLQGCEKETTALVTKNHSLLTTQTDIITSISQTVTVTNRQTLSLQSLMQQMYSKLLEMHNTLQNQVPAQIEFQQPVSLEDPYGDTFPFHLEFINSWEAFEAVMDVRISN